MSLDLQPWCVGAGSVVSSGTTRVHYWVFWNKHWWDRKDQVVQWISSIWQQAVTDQNNKYSVYATIRVWWISGLSLFSSDLVSCIAWSILSGTEWKTDDSKTGLQQQKSGQQDSSRVKTRHILGITPLHSWVVWIKSEMNVNKSDLLATIIWFPLVRCFWFSKQDERSSGLPACVCISSLSITSWHQ